MSLLRTIESRIAHLVEGTFGRVFRTNVQPVEIARRLVTEMDAGTKRAVRSVHAPNVFDVYLSRDDFRQFRDIQASLASELSEYLAEHARRNGYALATRPRVALHMDKDLELGSFGIAAKMEQKPAVAEPTPPAQHTTVFPAAPAALSAAGHALGDYALVAGGERLVLDRARMTIGRGKTNDLVLQDSSVSREHAEVVLDNGTFTIRDLDSTNGLMVNGARVHTQELAAGDELLLGSARVRFEQAGGAGGRT